MAERGGEDYPCTIHQPVSRTLGIREGWSDPEGWTGLTEPLVPIERLQATELRSTQLAFVWTLSASLPNGLDTQN